ncbi:MAG: hypothetical protein E7121_01150 [Bacteroidales bacterium]|nr:hypothetical protein [Bacteroidales bacterium]
MKLIRCCKLALCLLSAFIVAACSTTKVIPQGQSRLKANRIIVENSKDYLSSDLQPYLKQKPNTSFIFGWNPFLNIYNWSNGKGKGWDKFVQKLGQVPVIFDSTLVASSKTNMYNHLVYDGYYNSSIRDSIVTKRKKSTVYYKVKLGRQYVIDSISYSIADPKLAGFIYADTVNSLLHNNDILSENRLEQESGRVEEYLRNNGYYGFSKNYFFFEADTLSGDGKASLNVTVADYTRNELAKNGRPHRQFTFGDVYIRPMRSNFQSRIQMAQIGDSVGRSEFARRVQGLRTLDTSYYRGTYIIHNGKPLLRKSVLARMNTIKKGELYNEQSVANTYRRFSNIGVFGSVNVQLEESDSSTVKTNIQLTASALQGYKLNLEASTNSSGLFGIAPTLSYYHKNIFRGGELFTLSFMGDFQFKLNEDVRSTEFGVSSSLSIPNFLLLPNRLFHSVLMPKTEVAVSYNYQDRPEYIRNIISASYGYSWNTRNNRMFFKINPVQVNIVKLTNLSESFYESLKDPFLKNSYQNHFDFGLGASLYYTTDASPDPKKSYFYLRWQNDIAGNLLSLFNKAFSQNEQGERLIWGSPYSQYYRGEITAVYTWKFGKTNRQALASRLLVGAGTGYGNSIQLPFEKLFWAGGAYSLRAWQARTVGPGYAPEDTTFSIPNQTGDIRLEANVEYRFPLFWSFDGAVFVDTGNVWNVRRSYSEADKKEISSATEQAGVFKFNTFYKHIAADWGIGLRLNLGFALLRLDWGMKIYDPPTDLWMGPGSWFKKGNYGIQFGVGYPF